VHSIRSVDALFTSTAMDGPDSALDISISLR
jgi:hypothetical protein